MQNFSFLSLDKKPIALQIYHWIYHQSLSQMMGLSSGPIGLQWETSICFIMFSKKEEVESIGNPAGIGQGTGFGLRERDRDGIGLGLSRLRATLNKWGDLNPGTTVLMLCNAVLCCRIPSSSKAPTSEY